MFTLTDFLLEQSQRTSGIEICRSLNHNHSLNVLPQSLDETSQEIIGVSILMV
jgi:hypothetical protein